VTLHNQSQRQSISPKTTSAAHAVLEVGVVGLLPAVSLDNWHVKVDHDVYLRHIKASRQHVCRYENWELFLPKLVNNMVAIFVLHTTNQNLGVQIVKFFQFLFKEDSLFLWIDEDHRHGFAHFTEDIGNELYLLGLIEFNF